MSFDVPPPDPELRRLESLIGSWRAEAGRYRIIFFSNNGAFSEEGNQYFGRLEDGGLVFEGPARFRYELDDEGGVRTNPAGTITVDWWLRDERGDWQPWMRNTFERVDG